MIKPINITVDNYPGWESSISPYRLTVNGKSYRPMTQNEVNSQIDFILNSGMSNE